MPTGKDCLNPGGLMEAAPVAGDRQAQAQAEAGAAVERLVSQLGDSEEFAAQFDEAVIGHLRARRGGERRHRRRGQLSRPTYNSAARV
jgi:hypothetical protein